MFRKHGHVFVQPGEVFAPQPSTTLMYSQGVVPEAYPPFTDTLDDRPMRTKLAKIRAEIKREVDQMRRHEDFIASQSAAVPIAN